MNVQEPSQKLDADRRQFRRRLTIVMGLLLLGVVAAIVVAWVPPTAGSFYPKCASYSLLGIHCPGCGMTRAAHSAFHGHFLQALAYNPFAPIALPVIAFMVGRSLWLWVRDEEPTRTYISPKVGWAIVIFMLLFTVLRNLPWEPFTLLAPHTLS